MIMEIGGVTIERIAFQVFGDYRTLEDHVERHRYWICRTSGPLVIGIVNGPLELIHRKEP